MNSIFQLFPNLISIEDDVFKIIYIITYIELFFFSIYLFLLIQNNLKIFLIFIVKCIDI